MNEINYENMIFFDLETSGRDWNKHEIIQVAAIDATTGDEFMRRLDFDIDKAEPEALEVNGFNEELWDKEAVSQEEAILDFTRFLRRHARLEFLNKKTNRQYKLAALAGFNVMAFDKFFLREWYDKWNIFMPADYRMYDFLQLALWKYPNLKAYNLQALCKYLELEDRDFHDALVDVRATIEIAKVILSSPLNFTPVKWSEK